jgi:hypothetical protein
VRLINQIPTIEKIVGNFKKFFEEYGNMNNGNVLGRNTGMEMNRRNLEISCVVNDAPNGIYLNVKHFYHYDFLYPVSSLRVGKTYIDHKNRKCIIVKIDQSNNILSLRTPNENLFHFSFHTQNVMADRQDKGAGSFHMIIDRMRVNTHSIFDKISSNYRPFIVPYVKYNVTIDSSNNTITDNSNNTITDNSNNTITDNSNNIITDNSNNIINDSSYNTITDNSNIKDSSNNIVRDNSNNIVTDSSNKSINDSSNNIIMDVSNAFAKFEDFDSGVFDGYYTTKKQTYTYQ